MRSVKNSLTFQTAKTVFLIIASVVLAFALISLFAYFELYFMGMGDLYRRCFPPNANCTNEEFYSAVLRGVCRSQYVYNPITVVIVTAFISMFERSWLKFAIMFLSLLPIFVTQLFATTSVVKGVAFSLSYLALGFGMAYIVSKVFPQPKTSSEPKMG